jgi:hypothetical protein
MEKIKIKSKYMGSYRMVGWDGAVKFVLFTYNLPAISNEYIIENHLTPFINDKYIEYSLIQIMMVSIHMIY